MMKRQTIKWMKELIIAEPCDFHEYFYFEIGNYLGIINEKESEIKENLMKISKEKLLKLENCKSREEVKKWLDEICFYILSKLEVENIIDDYFSR